jgi:hypothetical protein
VRTLGTVMNATPTWALEWRDKDGMLVLTVLIEGVDEYRRVQRRTVNDTLLLIMEGGKSCTSVQLRQIAGEDPDDVSD